MALRGRVYYCINAVYTDDNLDMSHAPGVPQPPSDEQIDPSKPILVLIHAATSSSHSFIYQFRDPRMRAAFNLVSHDTRFYGWTLSKPLDRYMTLEERADETMDLLDAVIGDKPYMILGESFAGAQCALYIAAKRPQQVKGMVLVSPSFITDPPEMCEILEQQWAPLCAQNKFGNGDGTGRLPDEAMAIVRDYFFSGSTHEPERQEAFLKQYQEQHGWNLDLFNVNQLLYWFRRKAPPPEIFQAIRVPVLLLGGTCDTAVNPEDALNDWYKVLENVPEDKKRIERIQGGSHFLATTSANLVNRFILTFFSRHGLITPPTPVQSPPLSPFAAPSA
ncbi:hypothetical protein JCM8547_001093 [Rhodosporidiobolus lusitaniae]